MIVAPYWDGYDQRTEAAMATTSSNATAYESSSTNAPGSGATVAGNASMGRSDGMTGGVTGGGDYASSSLSASESATFSEHRSVMGAGTVKTGTGTAGGSSSASSTQQESEAGTFTYFYAETIAGGSYTVASGSGGTVIATTSWRRMQPSTATSSSTYSVTYGETSSETWEDPIASIETAYTTELTTTEVEGTTTTETEWASTAWTTSDADGVPVPTVTTATVAGTTSTETSKTLDTIIAVEVATVELPWALAAERVYPGLCKRLFWTASAPVGMVRLCELHTGVATRETLRELTTAEGATTAALNTSFSTETAGHTTTGSTHSASGSSTEATSLATTTEHPAVLVPLFEPVGTVVMMRPGYQYADATGPLHDVYQLYSIAVAGSVTDTLEHFYREVGSTASVGAGLKRVFAHPEDTIILVSPHATPTMTSADLPNGSRLVDEAATVTWEPGIYRVTEVSGDSSTSTFSTLTGTMSETYANGVALAVEAISAVRAATFGASSPLAVWELPCIDLDHTLYP